MMGIRASGPNPDKVLKLTLTIQNKQRPKPLQ